MVRQLGGAPYQSSFSALSPDGRFVAMGVIDFGRRDANLGVVWHIDVFEASTWKLVGRISPPEKSTAEPPQFAFSPDGKELAVLFRAAKEVSVFPIPGE
jgi:hypothetical protein